MASSTLCWIKAGRTGLNKRPSIGYARPLSEQPERIFMSTKGGVIDCFSFLINQETLKLFNFGFHHMQYTTPRQVFLNCCTETDGFHNHCSYI